MADTNKTRLCVLSVLALYICGNEWSSLVILYRIMISLLLFDGVRGDCMLCRKVLGENDFSTFIVK